MNDPFIHLGSANAARMSTILGWSVLAEYTDPDGNQHERRMIIRFAFGGATMLYGTEMNQAIEALIAARVATEALRAEKAIVPDEKTSDAWTRGALYALALACRLDTPSVAREGLGAMGIRTIAELEASGADEYDLGPLRLVLWQAGDKPAAPAPDAWMTAHHYGDGWSLYWVTEADGGLADIPWPFGKSELAPDMMASLGFEVV